MDVGRAGRVRGGPAGAVGADLGQGAAHGLAVGAGAAAREYVDAFAGVGIDQTVA
ncbi:hypothetical protein GCM10010415_54340 [Streptomyces atrovirens]